MFASIFLLQAFHRYLKISNWSYLRVNTKEWREHRTAGETRHYRLCHGVLWLVQLSGWWCIFRASFCRLSHSARSSNFLPGKYTPTDWHSQPSGETAGNTQPYLHSCPLCASDAFIQDSFCLSSLENNPSVFSWSREGYWMQRKRVGTWDVIIS